MKPKTLAFSIAVLLAVTAGCNRNDDPGDLAALEEDFRQSLSGATWARARCDQLEAGRLDHLLQVLRSRAGNCEPAQRCADYLERNRDRMRYAAFREQGLCVASGVVEAGCKTVIGSRLKRAGMHWTVAGANAVIALRCCKLSGRYEDFWESRSPSGRPLHGGGSKRSPRGKIHHYEGLENSRGSLALSGPDSIRCS